MAEVWQWQSQDDYDEWLNELMAHAPECYDGDASMESIVDDYVHDLEASVRWLLDHMAVCVEDDGYKVTWPLKGWEAVPPQMQRIMRGYVETAGVGG